MEKEEQALELERRRLARLQMTRKPMADQSYFGHCVHNKFSLPSAEHFGHLLDVMNSDDSPTDDKFRHKDTNHSDHDRPKSYTNDGLKNYSTQEHKGRITKRKKIPKRKKRVPSRQISALRLGYSS
ncbi:unnamed protein product [Dovyalis caffra]|uniref:Uncharacterized protein n=1 Tax=Dovyalis caffra TaxID=77055 RepID=A0AAV1QUR6_9ROSI|nr:unnamed protein product [Dovyalis caffra]